MSIKFYMVIFFAFIFFIYPLFESGAIFRDNDSYDSFDSEATIAYPSLPLAEEPEPQVFHEFVEPLPCPKKDIIAEEGTSIALWRRNEIVLSFYEQDEQGKGYGLLKSFPRDVTQKSIVASLHNTNFFGTPHVGCIVKLGEDQFNEQAEAEDFFSPFSPPQVTIYHIPDVFDYLYIVMNEETGELTFATFS